MRKTNNDTQISLKVFVSAAIVRKFLISFPEEKKIQFLWWKFNKRRNGPKWDFQMKWAEGFAQTEMDVFAQW